MQPWASSGLRLPDQLAILATLLLAAGCGAQANGTFAPLATSTVVEDARTLIVNGRLDPDDPTDSGRPGCHFKTYEFRMAAGTEYVIDLRSRDVDAFLRILDGDGKLVAEDDDSGGGQDARL